MRKNAAALRLCALARTGRSSPTGRGAGLQTSLQDFVGRLGIDGLVVLALQRTPVDHRGAFFRAYRPDPGRRRTHQDAIDHRGGAVALEERHQRLALAELGNDLGGVQLRIGPEGIGRGRDSLLIARREGA